MSIDAPEAQTTSVAALTIGPATVQFADRLQRLADRAATAGVDAIVVSPGADLRYLVGHSVASHERLTCLVIAPDRPPTMLVPLLERPGWFGTSAEQVGVEFTTWRDGEDPYSALAGLLPEEARVLSVDDNLPAMHALGLQWSVPGSELTLAGSTIAELRMRKDEAEVAALAAVGAAIDRVHQRMHEWLRPGRTEHQVAADIAAAMVAEGHESAAFVIVASGPNGASPHHEASERVIGDGDPVVVDIGGPSVAGYHSDSTRTYVAGAVAAADFAEVYEIVRTAQLAGVAAAVVGASCESVDAASRAVITEAGYGEYFVTRTGHGIGLEVHEHPYLVRGNTRLLEPGMAFSVEPGIYLPGRFGIRIEDVVVAADAGPLRMNTTSTDLILLG